MTKMPLRPRIVAVIAAGRLVHLTDAGRLLRFVHRAAQGGCGRVSRLYSAAMANRPRYAIYYAPAPGSAASIASARNCSAMTPLAATTCPFRTTCMQAAPDWRELTDDPRKYGFHATLKAPMALAPGKTEAELVAACERVRRNAPRRSRSSRRWSIRSAASSP